MVIVSEETRTVPYAYTGHIYCHLEEDGLRNILPNSLVQDKAKGVGNVLQKWSPLK